MNGQSPNTNLSDDELLQQYLQYRDNRYLGLLLQRYTTLLFGVSLKYLKDREQARDAVQQVFLKVLTHFPDQGVQNFKGWLYILTRNHCLQELRDRKYVPGDEQLANAVQLDADKDEIIWKEQTLEHIEQALMELPAEQRQSIDLFYLKKKTYQQIMEETGFTFMQVKSYIQNGKRKLKMILSQRGSK